MIDRVSALCLAGSVLFAAILPLEFRSTVVKTTVSTARPAKLDERLVAQNDEPAVKQLVTTILARPLFSATRRPPEIASEDHPDTPLSDMRLTGILITPDQHLAIFAMSGGKPLVRSEGETISDWRIENIATQSVSLSGPTGTTTLEPKADPNLVRLQAAAQPGMPPPQATTAAAPNPDTPVRPPIPIRRSSR